VPNVGLRFFNVFGPRQIADVPCAAAIPSFCARIRERRPVTVYGDGGQMRDFVFVRDAVSALIAAMDANPHATELFNVCNGKGISIAELARLIGRLAGVSVELDFRPARLYEVRHSLGNPARAHDALGFEAHTDLETGLRLTLKSFGELAAV
jgi:UDP-glucose 4-epimerase